MNEDRLEGNADCPQRSWYQNDSLERSRQWDHFLNTLRILLGIFNDLNIQAHLAIDAHSQLFLKANDCIDLKASQFSEKNDRDDPTISDSAADRSHWSPYAFRSDGHLRTAVECCGGCRTFGRSFYDSIFSVACSVQDGIMPCSCVSGLELAMSSTIDGSKAGCGEERMG